MTRRLAMSVMRRREIQQIIVVLATDKSDNHFVKNILHVRGFEWVYRDVAMGLLRLLATAFHISCKLTPTVFSTCIYFSYVSVSFFNFCFGSHSLC